MRPGCERGNGRLTAGGGRAIAAAHRAEVLLREDPAAIGPGPRARPTDLALVSGLCLAAAAPWLLHGARWPAVVVEQLDHCPQLACDFTGHYLAQARLLAEGQGAIHPGWFYPPLLALPLQLLAPLPDRTAALVWTGGNLLLALGLALYAARALERIAPRPLALAGGVALVGTSLPVLHCLKWGQVSLLLGLGGLWALSGQGRGRGAVIGLLGAIKVLPLAWLAVPLAGRRWRTLGEGLLAALVLGVAVPLAWLGPDALPFFSRVLDARGLQAGPLGGQALSPSLTRWLVDAAHIGGQRQAPPMLFHAPLLAALLTALGPLVIVGLSLLRLRRCPPSPAAAALALLAFTLALPPGWHHYFAVLPVAQALVLADRRPSLRALGLGSLALSLGPVLVLAPATWLWTSQAGLTTLSALLSWLGLLVLTGRSPGAVAPGAPG